MKKLLTASYGGLFFLCICQFYACSKLPPHFEPADANNVYTACRVKRISNETPYGVTRVFYYNSNNDPDSVTNSRLGTGNPNLYFRYDNRKRLIQCSAEYFGRATFEGLHRYGYTQNRITTDTIFSLGSFDASGNPVNYIGKRISYLKYDQFNRVVSDSLPPTPYLNVTTYNYDAVGNLLIPRQEGDGYVQYDNKLNPHRTNKIWMFLDRNYSVNTSRKATAYNAAGLPLHYNIATETDYGLFNFALQLVGFNSDIAYECR